MQNSLRDYHFFAEHGKPLESGSDSLDATLTETSAANATTADATMSATTTGVTHDQFLVLGYRFRYLGPC